MKNKLTKAQEKKVSDLAEMITNYINEVPRSLILKDVFHDVEPDYELRKIMRISAVYTGIYQSFVILLKSAMESGDTQIIDQVIRELTALRDETVVEV